MRQHEGGSSATCAAQETAAPKRKRALLQHWPRAGYEERTAYARAESRPHRARSARPPRSRRRSRHSKTRSTRPPAHRWAPVSPAFSNMFSPTNLIYGAAARLVLSMIGVARNLLTTPAPKGAADQATAHLEQFAAPEHRAGWHHQSDQARQQGNDHRDKRHEPMPRSWRRTPPAAAI